jgi:RNA polymerase sigma-70 factor (ECF subfamily)
VVVTADSDRALLERLRAGDEIAFTELVERYSGALMRLVRMYVPSAAVAEQVVQETWLGVLAGLDGFKGRSSLRTWVFRIALDRALPGPFASLADREAGEEHPAVAPDRFLGPDDDRWPRHWATEPRRWEHAESDEAVARVRAAIAQLPPAQRTVIALRDIEAWESSEICNALDISETNQRVLLHRARSRVRADLESSFAT